MSASPCSPPGRRTSAPQVRLGLEFQAGDGGAARVSPRHITLLRSIEQHGSISAAARSVGLAYRGAWLMLALMEDCVGCKLLVRNIGGRRGGGSALSEEAKVLLSLLAEMEDRLDERLARLGATCDPNTAALARPRPAAGARGNRP